MGPYLPAGVGGLPLQYVLRERWRLQLILVKGHLVYNHGLRIQAGETDMWVGWTWRLDGTQRGMVNTYKWTAFYNFFLTSFLGQLLTGFFQHQGSKPAHLSIQGLVFVINIYKNKTLSYYFFHKKLVMSQYLPELESSGQARRPQEWASGQWAHRF